jgi:uncharacterized protein YfaS (alpha-2-macroglobulin family)
MLKRLIRFALLVFLIFFSGGYLQAEVAAGANGQIERSLLQLNILNVSEQWVADKKGIVITFSHDLENDLVFSKFITVTEGKTAVNGEWKRLPGHTNSIYLSPIKQGKTYQIFIRPGLSSNNGLTLLKPAHFSLHTMGHQVDIEFSGHTEALSAETYKNLQLRTSGLEQLQVKVLQVTPEKQDAFRAYLQKTTDDTAYIDNVEALGDVVFEHSYEHEPAALLSRQIIELDWINGGEQIAGIYLISVEGLSQQKQEKKVESGANEAVGLSSMTKKALFWFTISDAYTLIRQYQSEIVVYTGLKSDGQPIQGSTIQLFQQDNDETKLSGKQGLVRFSKDASVEKVLVWVNGKHGVNIQPLTLEHSQPLAEDTVEPLRGQLWLKNTYYKPGEHVEINGIIRQGGAAVAGKAIMLRFKALTEHELFYRRELNTSELGAFETTYTLPDDVEGYYQLALYSPEDDEVLATEHFYVAQVMPDEVSLQATTNLPRLTKQQNTLLTFQVDGLNENITESVRDIVTRRTVQLERNPSEKYADYTFGRASDSKLSGYESLSLVQPDKEGKAELKIPAIKNTINSPLKFTYQAEFMQGDVVYATADTTQTYWPYKTLIGVKPVFESPLIDSLFDAEFEIIRIDTDDALIAADELQIELFKLDQESDKKVVVSKPTLSFAEKEIGKLTLPVDQGFYELSITDPETTMETRYSFVVDKPVGVKKDQKTLKLSLDKPEYLPGDKAILSYETQLESELLVFVEGSDLFAFETLHPTTGEGTVELQLDKKWKNSGGLNITVVGFNHHLESGDLQRISASVPLIIRQDKHIPAVLENNELSFQLTTEASVEGVLVLYPDQPFNDCAEQSTSFPSALVFPAIAFNEAGNVSLPMPDSLPVLDDIKGFQGVLYLPETERPIYLALKSFN